MNELLAIIIIVLVCCCMFFAWLISMATCPDTMVNFISGSRNGSSCSSSHSLLPHKHNDADDEPTPLVKTQPNVVLQLNGSKKVDASKKLSVVPEQDEQLTVQSMAQNVRPSILRNSSVEQKPRSPIEIV